MGIYNSAMQWINYNFYVSCFCIISCLEISSIPKWNKAAQVCPFSLKGNYTWFNYVFVKKNSVLFVD